MSSSTCARSGYLVDATQPIPADPTERHVEGLPLVGCNRLQCSRCRSAVRNAPGVSLTRDEDLAQAELIALHDSADLASSALLQQGHPQWRLYLCRCSRWLETSEHSCDALPSAVPALFDDTPSGTRSESTFDWRCGGHPHIALPHCIDGILVSSPSELREVVRRGFEGIAPPDVRAHEKESGEWLVRLLARLTPPDAEIVTQIATEFLEDQTIYGCTLARRVLAPAPITPPTSHGVAPPRGAPGVFRGDLHDLLGRVPTLRLTPGALHRLSSLVLSSRWYELKALIHPPSSSCTSALLIEMLDREDLKRKITCRGADVLIGDTDEVLAVLETPLEVKPALEDPRLRRALEDGGFRELLVDSKDPIGHYLRRAGAFREPLYEEIQHTDWNGANVGTGTGLLLRGGMPPSADLPYAELAPLLDMGAFARELVITHPSTPREVLASLATAPRGRR